MHVPLDSVQSLRSLFTQILSRNTLDKSDHIYPIVISFDVAHGRKKGFSAVGVSFLDTRFLQHLPSQTEAQEHILFQTRTFIFNYGSQGVKRAGKRALFDAIAQKVSAKYRTSLLRYIFCHFNDNNPLASCGSNTFPAFMTPTSHQSMSKGKLVRPIILVGHAMKQDLESLQKAGFEITQEVPLLACMDTQKIARSLYWEDNPSKNVSLKDLCKLMGFEAKRLHDCGNDAAYTLLCSLALVREILGADASTQNERAKLSSLIEHAKDFNRTAKQHRKKLRKAENNIEDWADHLDAQNLVRPDDLQPSLAFLPVEEL